MIQNSVTDFFDSKVQKELNENGCFIYTMENETGKGVITQHNILPGIELFFNDFHMSDGHNKNKLPREGIIEINHCREGRFECEFSNGDFQYVGAGDLSIHRLMQETKNTLFPMSYYYGISITIDLNKATNMLRKLENVMGSLDIDLYKIAETLCDKDTCFVLRGKSAIQHIFSELYTVEPDMIAHYLKVKVLELLMYLNDIEVDEYIREKRYFSNNQVKIIKEIHDFMIKNISHHYTLNELSDMFGISLTSMKVCFKGVYGRSIYSYIKSYRMQIATVLLTEKKLSITDIAMKIGYENPSKFSECFKNEFGKLPSEFKKQLSK